MKCQTCNGTLIKDGNLPCDWKHEQGHCIAYLLERHRKQVNEYEAWNTDLEGANARLQERVSELETVVESRDDQMWVAREGWRLEELKNARLRAALSNLFSHLPPAVVCPKETQEQYYNAIKNAQDVLSESRQDSPIPGDTKRLLEFFGVVDGDKVSARQDSDDDK